MKKNIAMNVKGIALLLCVLGTLFLIIGISVCILTGISNRISPTDVIFLNIIFLGLFGGFGIAMMIAGVVIFRRKSSKERMKQRLIEEGNYVWAEIMEVSQNYSIQINGNFPFVLRCSYGHHDGNIYIFKSEYLRFDPYLLLKEGRVKVWLDREEIKNYYIDIEGSLQGRIIEV